MFRLDTTSRPVRVPHACGHELTYWTSDTPEKVIARRAPTTCGNCVESWRAEAPKPADTIRVSEIEEGAGYVAGFDGRPRAASRYTAHGRGLGH
jgi:hypothetical protein